MTLWGGADFLSDDPLAAGHVFDLHLWLIKLNSARSINTNSKCVSFSDLSCPCTSSPRICTYEGTRRGCFRATGGQQASSRKSICSLVETGQGSPPAGVWVSACTYRRLFSCALPGARPRDPTSTQQLVHHRSPSGFVKARQCPRN